MQRDSSKLQVSDDLCCTITALTLKRLAYTVFLPYIPGKVYHFEGAYCLAAIFDIMNYSRFRLKISLPSQTVERLII
jgi:hypothetical protein